MGDWGLGDGQRIAMVGTDAATSEGTQLTASSTADTEGSWVELAASTAFPATGLIVSVRHVTAAADFLVDIGIGGAGSEQVLIPNLVGASGTGNCSRAPLLYIPIRVPAGSRLSARCQSSGTGTFRAYVAVALLATGFLGHPGFSRMIAYTGSGSSGITIDPGGTAHTKGSWTQIVASITNPIRTLYAGISNMANTTRATGHWLLDIGVGGAGSEQVIVPDLTLEAATTEDTMAPALIGPIPVSIPDGVRLSARAQSTITTTVAQRQFGLTLYGLD